MIYNGLWVFGLALLLAACAVGPDYHRPEMQLPSTYQRDNHSWVAAQPNDRQDRGAWWLVFHDAELNRLEQLALRANTSLAVAVAERDQAQAGLAAARAGFWPTLGVSAQQSRSRSFMYGSADHSLGAVASWEPDLWGSIRRAVEQQGALEQSAEAQMANVRLSMAAQVAQGYFALVNQQLKLNLDAHEAQINQQLLDLTRAQEHSGTVTLATVVQARAQQESSEAQLHQDHWQLEQLEHALAVLCGQPSEHFKVQVLPIWPVLPAVPAGIPAQLLQRRPDIASAERSMAAANAGIGLAVAAWYPTVTLSANVAWEANRWGDWLSAPYRYWSLGPSLAGMLFEGGKRRAAKASAEAAYRQMVATYKGQILAALQEVEDNLSALYGLQQQNAATQAALRDAKMAWSLTQAQYQFGTVTYLDVLNSEQAMYADQVVDLSVQALRFSNTVLLIQALGGGWQAI